MLGIPSSFDLSGLTSFIQSFKKPAKITIEEIDSLTNDIKNLKALKEQVSAEKRTAQQPHEAERKKYSTLFETAKDDKKKAGEAYVPLEQWVKNTETDLRGLIDTALAEQERIRREKEQAAQQALLEAERTQREAEEAAAKARRSGDELDQQEAAKAKQQAEAAALATPTTTQSFEPTPANISKAKILDFVVTDVSQVPDDYVDYVPNTSLIYEKISDQFPFIKDMSVVLDEDLVPDEYMHDVVSQDKVMKDLREEKDIPGIEIKYKERTIIR